MTVRNVQGQFSSRPSTLFPIVCGLLLPAMLEG